MKSDQCSEQSTAVDFTGLRCPKCEYDLRASSGEACAECGAPFDAQELRMIYNDDRNNQDKARKIARRCFIVSASLLLLQLVNLAFFRFLGRSVAENFLIFFALVVALIAQPALLLFAVCSLGWANLSTERLTAMFTIATIATSVTGLFVLRRACQLVLTF